jgi:hypothetical protein
MIDTTTNPAVSPEKAAAFDENLVFTVAGETAKKLALTPSQLPKIGSEMLLKARCEVLEVGNERDAVEGDQPFMTLAITAMQLDKAQALPEPPKRPTDPAERLYG